MLQIKRKALASLMIIGLASMVWAEEGKSREVTALSITASTRNEVKVAFEYSRIIGNKLTVTAGAGITPVSLTGSLEARLTPVAFFQLIAGGTIGSGWNIPLADGLRLNNGGASHDSILSGGALDGLVWSLKGGAVFQADLAALVPGEWNHVVFQSTHVFHYRAYTKAKVDEAWLFEADDGENMNGWNYYGNYFLGYRMPLFVSMIGFLAEEDLYLYTTEGRTLWGDDISRWTLGPLVTFKISKAISATAMVQARTRRNYTDATEDYGFYQDRRIDTDDERRLEFYRAVGIIRVEL